MYGEKQVPCVIFPIWCNYCGILGRQDIEIPESVGSLTHSLRQVSDQDWWELMALLIFTWSVIPKNSQKIPNYS